MFVGFSSNMKKKKKQERLLMSRKTCIFHNKTKNPADYTLRASTKDSVTAQVSTRKGFSLGIDVGVHMGPPLGGAGIGASGNFSKSREAMHGETSLSKREMEARATVLPDQLIFATECVFNCEYEAVCKFKLSVNEDFELKYSAPDAPAKYLRSGLIIPRISFIAEKVSVRDIGFEENDEDFLEEFYKEAESDSEKKKRKKFTNYLSLTLP